MLDIAVNRGDLAKRIHVVRVLGENFIKAVERLLRGRQVLGAVVAGLTGSYVESLPWLSKSELRWDSLAELTCEVLGEPPEI